MAAMGAQAFAVDDACCEPILIFILQAIFDVIDSALADDDEFSWRKVVPSCSLVLVRVRANRTGSDCFTLVMLWSTRSCAGAGGTRYCAVGFKYSICWLGLLVGIHNSSLGWHHSEITTTKDWNAHTCSIVLREVANVKGIRITQAGVSQEATAAQRSFVDFDLRYAMVHSSPFASHFVFVETRTEGCHRYDLERTPREGSDMFFWGYGGHGAWRADPRFELFACAYKTHTFQNETTGPSSWCSSLEHHRYFHFRW
jgi:hypothetical protein